MLGALVAGVMAASFFLPWVEMFGESMGPTMMFEESIPWGDMPWQFYAFLASFVLAGIACLLALTRQAAGAVMLIAGAIPYGLIAQQALSVRDQAQDLGLPLPGGGSPQDIMNNLDVLREFIGLGLPAYFIGAALCVVVGLGRMVRGA